MGVEKGKNPKHSRFHYFRARPAARRHLATAAQYVACGEAPGGGRASHNDAGRSDLIRGALPWHRDRYTASCSGWAGKDCAGLGGFDGLNIGGGIGMTVAAAMFGGGLK